jgi:hypothetical protein
VVWVCWRVELLITLNKINKYMLNKDSILLEEAYLSVTKKSTSVPSDQETVTTNPNEVVSAGPVNEPAPGVDMDMINSEVADVQPEDKDTTGMPVSMGDGEMEDPRLSEEDENEEDGMSIENLNSIRESIMKIASHCGTGYHLEPWQQQKLAIAMDNLAEVARRLH